METFGRNDIICSTCQIAYQPELFKATYDDPLAQICNECKAERSEAVEVKGYKQRGEPQTYSMFDCEAVLVYIEAMVKEEIIVIERMYREEEEIKVYFFVREDGEQLNLDLEG